MAMFIKKMDKFEKKFDKKMNHNKDRGRHSDQYMPSHGETSKHNHNHDSPRPQYNDQRPQYNDPPRSSKYEPNPQYQQKGSYQSKYNSGNKSHLLCHNW